MLRKGHRKIFLLFSYDEHLLGVANILASLGQEMVFPSAPWKAKFKRKTGKHTQNLNLKLKCL